MIHVDVKKNLKGSLGVMNLDVQLEISSGEMITLFGPSGAGKTSILRMIAGLLSPENGKISVNDEVWYHSIKGINLPPQKRKVGFVFQDYSLFPNMTVLENLMYALPRGENIKYVEELVEIVELGDLSDRQPDTLSGGQKQRVALARALVQKPEVLLLDEPLSALDHEMRIKLQHYILQVHREYQLTTILVSHDTSEIFKMSDELVILEQGKVIRKGKPSDIFNHQEVSGKFQFYGEVIEIIQQDFIYIISILIGNDLVKVIADEHEVDQLQLGDRVLVASKAFNPIIQKMKKS